MHAITMTNGKGAMAYTGTKPWHDVGNQLTADATREEWETEAGYKFRLLRSKVRYAIDKDAQNLLVMPEKHVIFRSDNRQPMSIVSEAFKIVQPADVLDYFAEVAERTGAKLETAGTLYGGKKFWAMATFGDTDFVIDPNDTMKCCLLMATACDGTMATVFKKVSERVVCANTLGSALNEKGQEVKVRHNSKVDFKAVNEQLGITVRDEFETAMASFRQMAKTKMTNEQMIQATVQLFHPNVQNYTLDEVIAATKQPAVKRVAEIAVNGIAIGASLAGCQGTAWGWLNACSQYVDHEGGSKDVSRRLDKAWFGTGEVIKNRAQELAMGQVHNAKAYNTVTTEVDGSALLDAVLHNTALVTG